MKAYRTTALEADVLLLAKLHFGHCPPTGGETVPIPPAMFERYRREQGKPQGHPVWLEYPLRRGTAHVRVVAES